LEHASQEILRAKYGLDADSIEKTVEAMVMGQQIQVRPENESAPPILKAAG
jgi:hypothetical protein